MPIKQGLIVSHGKNNERDFWTATGVAVHFSSMAEGILSSPSMQQNASGDKIQIITFNTRSEDYITIPKSSAIVILNITNDDSGTHSYSLFCDSSVYLTPGDKFSGEMNYRDGWENIGYGDSLTITFGSSGTSISTDSDSEWYATIMLILA